jgi:hypothetical protein
MPPVCDGCDWMPTHEWRRRLVRGCIPLQTERPHDRSEIVALQPSNSPIGFELRNIPRYDVSICITIQCKATIPLLRPKGDGISLSHSREVETW